MSVLSTLLWLMIGGGVLPPAQQINIMVQPVRVDLQPKPGEKVQVPINVRNLSPIHSARVQARLWDLYQSEEGGFTVMDPEVVESPPPPPTPSCLPFTRIDVQDFEIAPNGVQVVNLSLQIPVSARGFYSGCLIVQTVPEPRPGTIGVRIRFLVPILIQVYGSAVTRRLSVGSPSMEFSPRNEREPAGTVFKIPVKNTGESLARLTSELTVYSEVGGRYRKVATVPFRERSLLPGTEAVLSQKTTLRLPGGKYRLTAEVRLEGSAPFRSSAEVEYAGDPEAASAVFASELEVQPGVLEVEGVPGATRSASLLIRNAGSEPVKLMAVAGIPRTLQGVAYEGTIGDQLSCASWVSFGSTGQILNPGAERRISLLLRIPREGVDRSHYYASLFVVAQSPEGQPVGHAESLLVLKISRMEVKTRLVPSGRVTMTKVGEGLYNFVVRFSNLGSVHLNVVPSATLMDAQGSRVLKEMKPEETEAGYLLPLGTRAYSYNLDLKDVAPGTYALRFSAEYEKQRAITTVMVRVSQNANGERRLEIVEQIQPSGQGGR